MSNDSSVVALDDIRQDGESGGQRIVRAIHVNIDTRALLPADIGCMNGTLYVSTLQSKANQLELCLLQNYIVGTAK